METLQKAREKILTEITSDDPDVRSEYLARFKGQASTFSEAMANAMITWYELDAGSDQNENHAYVSALAYSAILLHVQSMKLFLSGQPVPAGNLSRQVVEAIALALLCSGSGSGKELNVLECFIKDEYSSSNAVRDVCRHYEKLKLNKDGVKALEDAQRFYHKYSHPTKMTIASVMSFSMEGKGLYVGAAFDKGKVASYDKEIESRVDLAKVFPNFVEAVKANVATWQKKSPP